MADQEGSSMQAAAGRVPKHGMCPKESEEIASPGVFDLRWEKKKLKTELDSSHRQLADTAEMAEMF